VYEVLCFELNTFVFDVDRSYVSQPPVDGGVASSIDEVDELITGFQSSESGLFDHERFFRSDSESIKEESV
jgi:hypothetical protein